MAAKIAAKNLNLKYQFCFKYKDKWSVYSYEANNLKFKYLEINIDILKVSSFPRWRPRWPRKIWNKCISVLLLYTKTNGCFYSYYVKNVVSKYVEIHNNNCIISKMAANMAAQNLDFVYLCSAIECKENEMSSHVN